MASSLDEFQPSGFGVDVDLAAFEKQQAADIKRKDKEAQARIDRERQVAYDKERRRDARREIYHWVAVAALILGILGGIIYGCTAWYQHSYQENAKKWIAWMQQCDKAGGIPVGERTSLTCTFTEGLLPYGNPYYESTSSWDKENGALWVDNCVKVGGSPVGFENKSICVFDSGARLPYGNMGA